MALLLDTHAVLWWWNGARNLSERVREAIAGETDILVSVASAYELALKYRLGKLPDMADPAEHWRPLMESNGFSSLPITEDVALKAGLLPPERRDPFDRLIAAQALAEDLTLVTCDRQIAGFGCRTLW